MAQKTPEKQSRKQQILQALVRELEHNPGQRITTASLAKAVGVSEAALYRHFPSKAKMFEAIIDFCEETVFGLIQQIIQNESSIFNRCQHIGASILLFSARNPGICRILLGNALVGEHERLLKRTDQFFQRIETQLKQILREAELNKELPYSGKSQIYADLIVAIIEGQISEYVRSNFRSEPEKNWQEQWQLIQQGMQAQPA